MTDVSSLEAYLDDHKPSVTRNINDFFRMGRIYRYLDTIVDAFDPPSSANLNKRIDFMLEEYSHHRTYGSDDGMAKFMSVYATTMQVLADHYVKKYS